MGLIYNIGSLGSVFIGARCTSRRCPALCYKTDLNSLNSFIISICARTCSIFRPSKPTVRLRMNTIINVILFSHLSGQFNLNRFHLKIFSGSTGSSTIFHPALPSCILNISTIRNIATILRIFQVNLQCLHPFGLTRDTSGRSVCYFTQPTICLHMGFIANSFRQCFFLICI